MKTHHYLGKNEKKKCFQIENFIIKVFDHLLIK